MDDLSKIIILHSQGPISSQYTAKNNSVRLLKKLQEFGSFNLLRNLPEFFQENLYGNFQELSGIFSGKDPVCFHTTNML
jgi:hypothetical protein